MLGSLVLPFAASSRVANAEDSEDIRRHCAQVGLDWGWTDFNYKNTGIGLSKLGPCQPRLGALVR